MGDEQQAIDALMDATRALVGVAARSIAEVADEVSLTQFRALVLVDARGSITMGELAEVLGVNPSTATRLCDVLEEKGLVDRTPLDGNRRVVIATLSETGQQLVRRALRRRQRQLAAAVGRLSPDAQRRLSRSLTELTRALGEVSDQAWALGWPERAIEHNSR
jgi:DNA-binding MarR family transcriptional regulator